MKYVVFCLFFLCFLGACSQGEADTEKANPEVIEEKVKAELAAEIEVLEDKLLKIQDASKDTATAFLMIEKAELYVQQFPADSLAPFLLFRAADVARGTGKFQKAIQMWDRTWRNYEEHQIAPGALFAQAFTYDAQLGDRKEADRYYRKFLFKYPEHPLAPQVKQLMKSIQKTPEELIREFEKQNQESQ